MRVAVVLCARRAPRGSLGVDATLVPDLCAHPGALAEASAGADRLVVGVCRGEYSRSRLQSEARRAGIDPLGMELVDLVEGAGDVERLAVLVTAAVARAAAFPGSEPRHAKLAMPHELSRRDLLRAFAPEYLAAPSIDGERCTAGTGCRACAEACPRQALRWVDGRIEYDRTACEPCGQCVTACPAGAVVNPAVTPAQVTAVVSKLLDTSVGPAGPRAIAFTCARGTVGVDAPRWYPVRVPCTAMVTGAWVLAPLLMGAGAVAVQACSAAGCPLGLDDRARSTVDFAAGLLVRLGDGHGRVRAQPEGAVPVGWPTVPISDPFGPLGGAEVLLALAAIMGTELPSVTHRRAPVGIARVDPGPCTRCAMCAAACPSGALAFERFDGVASLTFDAGRCTGCGQCVPRCPEVRAGALAVERRVDGAALAAGPVVAATDAVVRCAGCGRPVAGRRLLDRVQHRLGPEHAGLADVIGRYCVECRHRLLTPSP